MSNPIITNTPIIVPQLSEYPDTSPLWGLNPYAFLESFEGILCAKCRENYSYIDTMLVNGQPTEDAWCPKCLLDRFNEARDNEKKHPFWLHGEVQTPWMEHYGGLFTNEYMEDWRHKTLEWEVPVEERILCDCDAQPFVSQMYPGGTTMFQSCDDCGKGWCIKCGDPQRAPFGTPTVHSTATDPAGCNRVLATTAQKLQAQVAGLIKGADYQTCLVCKQHTANDSDPGRAQCTGCATIFCFTCGLKHAGQDWVPGPECTWKGWGHHP